MLQGLTEQINGRHGMQESRFELTKPDRWCRTYRRMDYCAAMSVTS